MQAVSQGWKENQRQTVVGESFVEVACSVIDPEAQSTAMPSDNGHEAFSDPETIISEAGLEPHRYATLEPGLWRLNGTLDLLPDRAPYLRSGYVGTHLSGTDGAFAMENRPVVVLSFSDVVQSTISGLTITWASSYGEWATEFTVRAFRRAVQIASAAVSGNGSVKSVVALELSGYDRIEIEIEGWCKPGRRARISRVLLGVERVYDKADLVKCTHTMHVDPLSASLPKAEFTFEVSNLDGEYNPDNPEGAWKYLIERQEISVRYGYKVGDAVEWIQAGTFFMASWDTPQNGITATFTARDLLEFMTDLYSGATTGSLYDIALRALEQAQLPLDHDGSVRWVIDEALKEIAAPAGAVLSDKTLAEVLQLVANAACCVLHQSRAGKLYIEPYTAAVGDYLIDANNSYSNSEISLTKQLKAVDVNEGMAVIGVEALGETQPVNNPLVSKDRAVAVAKWTADYLKNRRLLSGPFRADPRLDPLDGIQVKSQFAPNAVVVTDVELTYNGAFRGSYGGRAIMSLLEHERWLCGELICGEV